MHRTARPAASAAPGPGPPGGCRAASRPSDRRPPLCRRRAVGRGHVPHPGPQPPQGPAMDTPAGSKALRSQFCRRAQKGQGASQEQRARPPGAPPRQQAGGTSAGLKVTPPIAEARQNTQPATAVESELAEAKGQRGDKALAGEGAPPIGKQRGRRTHRDKRTAKVRAQDCQTKPRDKSPREGWWVASAHENVRSTRGRPRPDTSLPRADAGLEGSRAGPKKLEKTQQAGTPPTHAPHRPPAF